MKIFLLIAGIVIALAGLILLLATPIAGIFFVLLGVAFIVYSRKYHKKEPDPVEPAAADPDPVDTSRVVELNVAGTNYRQDEIAQLLTDENPDYRLTGESFLENADTPAYEYFTEWLPVRLFREKNNEYDPNAIAVFANDVQLGYLYRDDKAKLKEMSGKIQKIEAEIYGGKYKDIDFSDYEEAVITGETPYKARLYITLV